VLQVPHRLAPLFTSELLFLLRPVMAITLNPQVILHL
jgi:hypothetical protein